MQPQRDVLLWNLINGGGHTERGQASDENKDNDIFS